MTRVRGRGLLRSCNENFCNFPDNRILFHTPLNELPMPQEFDAIVIGAGPGGGATALRLARAGWSVAIVERKAFPRRKVCGEYLSASNLPMFEELGVADAFRQQAGPPVTHVGFYAGHALLHADLPKPAGTTEWGRALSREHLDPLILQNAVQAGATLWQPYTATTLQQDSGYYHVQLEGNGQACALRAPVVVAAHGSWDAGALPTQLQRDKPKRGDLFGFKAHFRQNRLPEGLMPLLAFPGGYGGMVHCEEDKASISFCIRRDTLARLRHHDPRDAAEVAFQHILHTCRGVAEALGSAERVGAWLATGPIRPGIRVKEDGGIFRVGNAAGEAHPVVAEGISMAMQAGWLVGEHLQAWRRAGGRVPELPTVGAAYARAWRRNFASRLRASRAIAHWAMRPMAITMSVPAMRLFPGLLTWGARLSGKATLVVN